jgi:hypothetical protein
MTQTTKYSHLIAFWTLAPFSAALAWVSNAFGKFVVKLGEKAQ